jgi:hypothetical protein
MYAACDTNWHFEKSVDRVLSPAIIASTLSSSTSNRLAAAGTAGAFLFRDGRPCLSPSASGSYKYCAYLSGFSELGSDGPFRPTYIVSSFPAVFSHELLAGFLFATFSLFFVTFHVSSTIH